MIKAKLEITDKVKRQTFPLLAKCKAADIVVAFTSEKQGCIVAGSDADTKRFFVEEQWKSCFNSKIWEILSSKDSIILNNESN
jgi:hypothetical protein